MRWDPIAAIEAARIVNATGTVTRLGASRLHPEVVAAMAEAASSSIDISTLQGRACDLLVEITGAQAGIVTSGAAAGLLLGTAACITGLDPAKMERLPDTRGMRNEFIVARSHRNSYDHAVRATGARLVEVGLPDRATGCGVRDTEAWEIEAAISERTAGVLYLASASARPDLPSIIRAAHAAGLPVLVDAAAEVPPARNLRTFTSDGADLVVFSGGKGLGGPSASGVLCGRRPLVAAALLQQLDLDYRYDEWDPPAQLIDKHALPGVPRHGIGRACKVGKEQIIGLLTAIGRFSQVDDAARNRDLSVITQGLLQSLQRFSRLQLQPVTDSAHGGRPLLQIHVPAGADGLDAARLDERLRRGTPSVHLDTTNVDRGVLVASPVCLEIDEIPAIEAAFASALHA